MNHFTDKDGWNAIRSQPIWVFKAAQPPCEHPVGAYFTTLSKDSPNLAKRLLIPVRKLQYWFVFRGEEGLRPLPSTGRQRHVFYSPEDYPVAADRQVEHGPTGIE